MRIPNYTPGEFYKVDNTYVQVIEADERAIEKLSKIPADIQREDLVYVESVPLYRSIWNMGSMAGWIEKSRLIPFGNNKKDRETIDLLNKSINYNPVDDVFLKSHYGK